MATTLLHHMSTADEYNLGPQMGKHRFRYAPEIAVSLVVVEPSIIAADAGSASRASLSPVGRPPALRRA